MERNRSALGAYLAEYSHWDSPLYYVATKLIGELHGPETGVGGSRAFELLSGRGIDTDSFTSYMNSQHVTGVSFTEYSSGNRGGSYLSVEPHAPADVTAINVYVVAEMNPQLHTNHRAEQRRERGNVLKMLRKHVDHVRN
jgi:hypothetical protein